MQEVTTFVIGAMLRQTFFWRAVCTWHDLLLAFLATVISSGGFYIATFFSWVPTCGWMVTDVYQIVVNAFHSISVSHLCSRIGIAWQSESLCPFVVLHFIKRLLSGTLLIIPL
jgi:hypothetical protein